eukprot:TRINITY_DN1551_c0_g1_i1.p1 TRINITY_DN1551_c0_g1~~TRINITY_DN1551_c0_g1_i1.p1  ORF type:complete len:550 (+),score=129.56 TRINITY_DN1551_c0_g1_i1:214-1863(+)
MAARLLRDTEADGWERSDFPIICESCLGENPYVRMTKASFDKECKICTRPFTVFRWRPGRDARYKKTEVCQTCSKLKNVCQVCLLDLEYGLPVQVRDSALGIDTDNDGIPKSDVNREFYAEEQDRLARAGIDYESTFGKARPNDTILKLQRTTPYYKRNRAHICSFFVRGECSRGAECPYRHEMPLTGELSQQNIKDRYYGVNDPVAKKLLRKAEEMTSLDPPADETIMTLYVGGLDERITEGDLKDHFYGFGEIESIRIVQSRSCGFIAYTTREAAEKAADHLANKLVIKGLRLKLMWGRPVPASLGPGAENSVGLLPAPARLSNGNEPAGPPRDAQEASYVPEDIRPTGSSRGAAEVYYPSMDPERMGAISSKGEGERSGEGAASQEQREQEDQEQLQQRQQQQEGYEQQQRQQQQWYEQQQLQQQQEQAQARQQQQQQLRQQQQPQRVELQQQRPVRPLQQHPIGWVPAPSAVPQRPAFPPMLYPGRMQQPLVPMRYVGQLPAGVRLGPGPVYAPGRPVYPPAPPPRRVAAGGPWPPARSAPPTRR